MSNEEKYTEKGWLHMLQQTIEAYDTMRENCLQQMYKAKTDDLKYRLIQTIWECEATIVTLQSVITRIVTKNSDKDNPML